MLAEYLSGGLRVFAGLVKVCRREDKLSVRRFHSPKTNFSRSRSQKVPGVPQHLRSPSRGPLWPPCRPVHSH
ncbi:hypothetical protein DPMN_153749 [Dreissena polymorpha]|uniref:Uncharacterized protein n=1 Tax=Dreissena polymorpha TaxID=45954 RepID=A0A9D4J9P1_DREPO|nr:hypothetical protein DPMN_153749 [Dreissena polymorpha]